ncbi:iron(III) transport system ATP-binding protein/putative spermidine/putrescine transport system ATP-binding protein [Stella humosa]|uniref:Iron(III) transport system ATP-binding protein/putative spermidine/putrescine transport system ATP-binding protein n=1 Tax=Stella humosa TaxID=94 RepID=A0A3N1KZ96_9PROT|nr:ABC transporter ATP-binding protein [Stella humosa]ROP83516.1 iron(III) transport system ATP-binding protein/putative spermidine/putrescine transport system ATP-binding protein [Stella humosa]BBK33211.1 ABC transporter ATP-binding protein [Stella humosa]
MTAIRLEGIVKRYGTAAAARIERLDIRDGEIVSLLGPSGCGKTTTLRIVAGLIEQDEGNLWFGDRLINDVPPERRNAAMVFQNYALFPHMTVRQNIAFGLEVRKRPRAEIDRKVDAVLELVQLPGTADRLPKQLSGGQQQRIAIARALATEPDVLLFDEPLSNLDAKLREYMRFELRKLLESLKITTLYVTHDQAEAMVISDRIVVMDKGAIVQVDTPHKVYRDPASRFVAEFVGTASFLEGRVESWDAGEGRGLVVTDEGLRLVGRGHGMQPGDPAVLCARPEAISLHPVSAATPDDLPGTIEAIVDLGEMVDFHVRIGTRAIRTRTLAGPRPGNQGDRVGVRLDPERCYVVAR